MNIIMCAIIRNSRPHLLENGDALAEQLPVRRGRLPERGRLGQLPLRRQPARRLVSYEDENPNRP